MKNRFIVTGVLVLGGCSAGGLSDLEAFVAESGREAQGKIEAPPQIQPYEAFSYTAFDLPDPFKPRTLSTVDNSGPQPDLSRPREPLEGYALETLKMVGVIARKARIYGVVQTPDNAIYQVRPGNYVGQDFGRVTRVDDTSIELREIVQDSAGDWSERNSTLELQE